MTFLYLVFEVTGDDDKGYGLSVTLPSGKTRSFRSLTFERREIDELCDKMNRLGVSECQLYDIIEDFLP